MKRFRLLKQTRQTTEYSCGASALQAVLHYWGKDADEEALMQLPGTTPEEGTYPEEIVRVARSLGFEAELKDHLSLEEVERATARGEPVIVLGQVWRSKKPGEQSLTVEWDSGHWFIALAVDRDYVYFEDPYVRMGKGFVPRQVFENAWHNVMGGDLSKPQQIRMGIFIRGTRRAAPERLREVDLSGLEAGRPGFADPDRHAIRGLRPALRFRGGSEGYSRHRHRKAGRLHLPAQGCRGPRHGRRGRPPAGGRGRDGDQHGARRARGFERQ